MRLNRHLPARAAVLARRHLLRPSFYVILGFILLIQYLLTSLVLPDMANTRVGIFNGGGTCAAAAEEDLRGMSSRYEWVFYTDPEVMRNDVATGFLDCAFILDERLDNADVDALQGTVTCITSTSSAKSFLVKEELFSVLLQELSGRVLESLSAAGEIFAAPTAETGEALEGTFRKLVGSDAVLRVFFEDAETGERIDSLEYDASVQGSKSADKAGAAGAAGSADPAGSAGAADPAGSAGSVNPAASADPVNHASSAGSVGATVSADPAGPDSSGGPAAVLAVLLFAGSLFFAAGRFRDDNRSITAALPAVSGRAFLFADLLAPLLFLGAALMAAAALEGAFTDVSIIGCLAAFLAGVPVMALWSSLYASLFRKESLYLFSVTALLLLSAALSARGAFAVSVLTKQFGWLRYLLPTSYFVMLLGI